MTRNSDTPGEPIWNRRRFLKSAGAAALAAGFAGCEGEFVTETEDSPGPGGGDTVQVLEVTARGATHDEAAALAGELDISTENVGDEAGVVQYFDPDAYLDVPMTDAPAETIEDEDSPDGRSVSAVLDVDALEGMADPPNADEMADRFVGALERAELHPASALPENATIETRTSHASFGYADVEGGTTQLERDLDTAVYLDAAVGGVPVVGPGANVRARFANRDGERVVSDLRHAFREVRTGPEVELLSRDDANSRYREALTATTDAQEFELDRPRLVYLAPDLLRDAEGRVGEGSAHARALVPHYEVGGTAVVDGEEASLLREFMPAVDDEEYVPQVELSASTEGSELTASVDVSGGQPSYRVEWELSVGVLADEAGDTPTELSATVRAREPIEETTLIVEVTDANGVTVRRRRQLSVEAEVVTPAASAGVGATLGADTDVPGTTDVGLEAAIWPSWADGFLQAARSNGASVNNAWKGTMVWERDFKAPTDDRYGADTADLVFEVGYGNPLGFGQTNGNHDDGWLHHTDADEAWGTHDCEWLALFSSHVLAPDDGNCGGCNGMSRIRRWWQEFDGLHQLHGFQTHGYRMGKFPGAYGQWTTGDYKTRSCSGDICTARNFGPLPVRKAWMLAVDNYQPGPGPFQARQRRAVVMGPMDANRRNTIDDYFHGNGQVGPDIPHEDVRYIWWVVGATGGG